MSSRLEFLSPEGLRLDGRRANELRGVSAKLSVLPKVDGSSLFELGNTRVLATVYGPREPRQKSHSQHDRVNVTARFHVATFSSVGGERRRQLRQDRRLNEWGKYLQEVFEAAIIVALFPRSQIEIFVEVLNSDGSVLAAAINAATLALIDAGVPLFDYVIACSVGHLSNSCLLDLNRREEGSGAISSHPTLTIACYGRNPNMCLLATGDSRLAGDKLESMNDMGKAGIRRLWELLDNTVVRSNLEEMSNSKGTKRT